MSSTMRAADAVELNEVIALLERMLPDPAGYGQRLIQQVVLQWAGSGQRPPTVVPGQAPGSGGASLLDLVRNRDARAAAPPPPFDDEPDVPDTASGSSDIQTVLASALGACDCWGARHDCSACDGAGAPGWADPDIDLFQKYVGPAAARLSVIWDEAPGQDERRENDDQPREGVNL